MPIEVSIGDRVRVSENWFVGHLRGAVGTVADPGNLPMTAGCAWVEFDEPHPALDPNHPTDAAEIDLEFLIRL